MKIADYINAAFEPTWQAVRPVPIVNIDFGNGIKLTRTLHGNIATYVCTPDGEVLDILPGIYQRDVYLDRLREFRLLFDVVSSPDGRAAKIVGYHRAQAEALARGEAAPRIAAPLRETKRKIERPVELALSVLQEPLQVGSDSPPAKLLESAEDIAAWKALAEDTRLNETIRRRMIHQQLAERGLVAPADITKWLYREVLHADLDDPYLGLGEVLFASYPFRAEDAQ